MTNPLTSGTAIGFQIKLPFQIQHLPYCESSTIIIDLPATDKACVGASTIQPGTDSFREITAPVHKPKFAVAVVSGKLYTLPYQDIQNLVFQYDSCETVPVSEKQDC